MKTFKVMVRDNLTGELTFSKNGMSIENAQQELFSHVGRMLIENGFDRSGSYSENKVTLAVSLEKLGPVGSGRIHTVDVVLIPQTKGVK